jgi:uncharacterized membrane protein YhaH (DUF805 family)
MDFLTGGGRISRQRFLLVAMLVSASSALAWQWTTYVHPVTDAFIIERDGYAVAVAFVWLQSMNAVRRLHDRGLSGYTVLVGLVPVLNVLWLLYLLFAPSTPTSNKWGPNPFSHPYRANVKTAFNSEKDRTEREAANKHFLNEDGSYDFDGLLHNRQTGSEP